MNFKKMSLKALSVLMAAMMLLGVCAPAIGAATWEHADHVHDNGKDELVYVSLGDSMTNGYGLPGYGTYGGSGVADYGDGSYANLFADRLGADEHVQLAMSAMRVEDLHWLLELDYNDAEAVAVAGMDQWDEAKWNATFTTGDYWTWHEICTHGRTYDTTEAILASGYTDFPATYGANGEFDGQIALIAKYYQEAVRNGDVISLGIGNGTFGVFMFGRILEALGFDDTPTMDKYKVENAIRECDPEIQAAILSFKTELEIMLDEYLATAGADLGIQQAVAGMYDTLLYTLISLALNYAGVLDAILNLNPDAEIIQVSLMNTFADESDVEDMTLGDLMNLVYTPMNAYFAALPTILQATGDHKEASFYWADAFAVECLVKDYEASIADGESVVRDRFITSIVGTAAVPGMVWGLLKMAPVDRAEIEAYEDMTDAAKLGYAAENADKAMAIVTYLAFEKAILASTDSAVTIESVLGLGGLSEDIFGGVMVAYNEACKVDTDSTLFATVCGIVAAQMSLQTGTAVTAENVAALYLSDNADVVGAVNAAYTLLVTPDALSASLLNDVTVSGLLNLFSRCIIGDGLGAHPSADGHVYIANALTKSYTEGYTTELETLNNLLAAAKAGYEVAYREAAAAGQIDLAIAYVDRAIVAVNDAILAVEAYTVDTTLAAAKAELINELNNTVVTLEALKADLAADKFATLEGALNTLTAYEDLLDQHLTTIRALAGELNVAALVYVTEALTAATDALTVAIDACADLVAGLIVDAYNNAMESVNAFFAPVVSEIEKQIAILEGYIAELEAALNELKDQVNHLNAEIRAEIAEIEAKIAEIKACINSLKEAIEGGIATIEEAVELINALVADVKSLVEFVENFELDFDFDLEIPSVEEIKATLASLIDLEALVEKVCTAVKTALTRMALALLNQIQSDVSGFVDGIVAGVLDIIDGIVSDTTDFIDGIFTDDYTITADSYYVAITGANSAYADLLAETLGVASNKQTWGALDFDDLAKADLITVGYDVTEVNSFAVNQLLAYAAELLDGEVRTAATAYVETVVNLMLADTVLSDDAVAEYAAEIQASLNGSVDEILASDLLADKTLAPMNWADVIGAEKLAIVEQALTAAEAELTAAGVPATYSYEFDVIEFIFNNTDLFGAELADLIAGFDQAEIYAKLGDKAYYTVEIPVAEVALLAVESCLYCNVTFQAELADTMATLAEINPDAAIAVLGQYNPFDGLAVELGETAICLGDAYDVVAKLASAHMLTYAISMPNVIYVDIADAADAGDLYITEQILNAYTITCAHSWIDATCTEAKTCALCGETEGEALGHVWTDATCTVAKTCEVCGETEGEAIGHTWTDATCTVAKTCSVCGETEGDALGHKWTDATCTVAKTCSTCGETEGDALGHKWTDATCTVAKTCSVCGATEGNANGHTEETIPAVPATCTEDGLTEGKKCSVCGEILAAQETIPAVGHTEEEIPGVEATCDEEGLEMGTKCSVCGEILLAQVTIPARGHNLTEATCTKAPYCTVCGEISEGVPIEHTWTEATCEQLATCTSCGASEGELAAHTYGEWTVVTEATKKAEGKQERTCTVCGGVESEAIPQLEGCASVLGTLTVICVTLAGAAVVIRKRDEE